MATITNGWYKGSIPFYEITEVSVATTGSGSESWETDGVMCYRSGTKVTIVCNSLTAIGEKAFFKFLALKKISGLGSVTTIGAYAFCYTPNLASIDIVPDNLTSIGASAFRMSSAEDGLDLSSVSLSIVGDMATRHKRWGADGLAAVKAVPFCQDIYMEVPNMDSQRAYPDIQYGTKDGEPLSVSESGCSALACYHIWNAMFAGTDKQYDNWLDWYNNVVNEDGTYASSNVFDGNVTPRLVSKIGWSTSGKISVDSATQLQTILNNLQKRYPTYISMHSVNVPSSYHAVAVVGCDMDSHKLAVVDSSVLEDRGVVSWVAFEDIFVGGTSEYDGVMPFAFNFPVLAPNTTWYKGTVSRSTITEVNIVDDYTATGSENESWNADVNNSGSIKCYRTGTVVTIAGNGSGKITLNTDSSQMFSGAETVTRFGSLRVIHGGNILDTSVATNMEKMFSYCLSLESIDVRNWATVNVTTMDIMFQNCKSLKSLDVRNWYTGNVTTMVAMFNMGSGNYNNSMTTLDVQNWDTSNVTSMQNMFANCLALEVLDVSRWKTGAVTNMSKAFANCASLRTLDVSRWDTSSCTTMGYMFSIDPKAEEYGYYSGRLQNLDVSNWDTSKVTSMCAMFQLQDEIREMDFGNWDTGNVADFTNMLNKTYGLKKITVGEKFTFSGNGATGSKAFRIDATDPSYIAGANGNWYDVNGNVIAPSAIPDKTFGVYYATPAIAEEDANEMVLVKKGNLMKVAAAIRTKTGNTKGYTLEEFASAITESL